MGSHKKKMHLVDMSSLSILFKAQSGVSHCVYMATRLLVLGRVIEFPLYKGCKVSFLKNVADESPVILKLTWIREQFRELSVATDEGNVMMYVKAYILVLIGLLVFLRGYSEIDISSTPLGSRGCW